MEMKLCRMTEWQRGSMINETCALVLVSCRKRLREHVSVVVIGSAGLHFVFWMLVDCSSYTFTTDRCWKWTGTYRYDDTD